MADVEKSDLPLDAGYGSKGLDTSSSVVRAKHLRRFSLVDNNEITGASRLTGRQAMIPIGFIFILYFLWGFNGGLHEALNKYFKDNLQLTFAQTYGMGAGFFAAYLIAPSTWASYFLRRLGYRWCFVIGLVIYSIGAFCMIPSAANRSYGGLLGCGFIIGSGMAQLEVAAVLYTCICGPPRYSELRVLLALGFQVLAQVIGSFVASRIVYKPELANGTLDENLQAVQYCYAGVGTACIVILLMTVAFFPYLYEITDADMEEQMTFACPPQSGQDHTHHALRPHHPPTSESVLSDTESPSTRRLKLETDLGNPQQTPSKITLPLRCQHILQVGAITCFLFIGAQVALSGSFMSYAMSVAPKLSSRTAAYLLAGAQSTFAFGRFVFAGLNYFFKPRYTFLISATIMLILLCISIIPSVKGNAALAVMIAQFFFKAPITATIFTLSTRGLGANTKRGSSILIATICGGAVFAPVLGVVADKHGVKTALAVPVAGIVAAFLFAVWVNGWKGDWLDAFAEAVARDRTDHFTQVDEPREREGSGATDETVMSNHTVDEIGKASPPEKKEEDAVAQQLKYKSRLEQEFIRTKT